YFELIGPKVQSNVHNPEKLDKHMLIQFAGERPANTDIPQVETLENVPTTYDGLREYLEGKDIEGIVWHHQDGRMAKIKVKDFGFKR
ncbi:MAG: hypothetical protein KGL39_47070, partial [Patescibacteria group bacterium]|nr:hypothetical protein [Patescibacteria group bacterium]